MGRRRFGWIRRLPSGRWQASFTDGTGTRVYAPMTFSAKGDAGRWLARTELEIHSGSWIDPRRGSVLLADWAAEYLASGVNWKPKTRYGYESLVRSVIAPTFGSMQIGSIETAMVRRWVGDLVKRGLSPSRVRQAYNLLGAIMKMAVAEGVIASTPCVGIKMPRLPAPTLEYLTPVQVAGLVHAMSQPYGLFVEVMAYGGLRFGEAAALTRATVDVTSGRLEVAASVAEVAGTLHLGDTKSHQTRYVVLPASVFAALADHLREHVGADRDARLFMAPRGGPLRYSNFMRNQWRPAVARAGLDGQTPHVLRHTSATLLIDAGASVKDVQRHLGHADASMTLNIYSAVMEGRNEELAQRLDEIREQAAVMDDDAGDDEAGT